MSTGDKNVLDQHQRNIDSRDDRGASLRKRSSGLEVGHGGKQRR